MKLIYSAATCSVLCFALAPALARADATANEGFATLKSLAGKWARAGADGKPMPGVVSVFRVTSAGSAIEETMLPGTGEEMVNLYTMDGADLAMTHYCAVGNQPHLKARPVKGAKTFDFLFASCGNLASPKAMHMHQMSMTLLDKDHLKVDWTSSMNGKLTQPETFSLVRK